MLDRDYYVDKEAVATETLAVALISHYVKEMPSRKLGWGPWAGEDYTMLIVRDLKADE